MIYVAIIVIFLSYILFIYRIDIDFNYKMLNFNILKTKIEFYILNKKIHTIGSNVTIDELINIYTKDETKKKMDLKISYQNIKKSASIIIKDISKEELHINVVVGLSNVIITTYSLVIITTIISKLLCQNVKYKDAKNIIYKVVPDYNNICIIFDSKLKIRLITIIKIFFYARKNKEVSKNGRTSNRKSNVNCYDKS